LKISIVVPAYNEERLLAETLQHIRQATAAFTSRGWLHEIVVCDNNSSDRTAAVARDSGAIVVFEPVNQISRARNRGATVATGDWLIFVDADSHPSRELFDDVAVGMETGRCLAGGAVIEMATARLVGRFFNGVWNWVSRCGRLMAGSFVFVDAAVFRAVGGFSETLFAGEELELAARLKEHGRGDGRRIVILTKHPLRTSGRKIELYGNREMAWFFLRALVAPQRVLQSREACHPWYDGRR
jgi:glycosyltransferase involved in cell wall biosynthesis